jgi:mono/diheme cytochrome c family protein
MARSIFIPVFFCLAAASFPAHAQTQSDGQAVAERACLSCHQIYGDRTSAKSNDSGASFQAMARMPSTTQLSVKVFLQSSHNNMPNLVLTREEIDALAAYMVSLAPK